MPAAQPASPAVRAASRPATRSKSPATKADPRQRNEPLLRDIRLLGRLLGEVIREQDGRETYELIERIRQLAVAYRAKRDDRAGKDLDKLLKNLSADQSVSVIRAFSYFSHLANLAEDRHQVRQRDAESRSGKPAEGTLALSLERLGEAGIRSDEIAALLQRAYVSPVLTAHPTEVQRKSILDTERSIAELIQRLDGLQDEPSPALKANGAARPAKGRISPEAASEREEVEAALRARITQLWQTRMLRFTKLTVADEIETALSYYRSTFLHEIPRLYAQLERALPGREIASFLRMGQWIGGDRDGNPNVTAATLKLALARQAETALRHYLVEVHHLGAELSMSGRLVHITPQMAGLADRSPDTNPHRSDEPYRRALTGVYARLAATLQALTGTEALRHAVAPQDPYASAEEFLADLQVVDASLRSHHAHPLADLRVRPLIRTVQVFGFHLATLDLRQSSDQHEAVIAELLAAAQVVPNYASLDEEAKQALLLKLLNELRPLRVRGVDYSDLARGELAIFEAAADARRLYGRQALRHYIISHTETVSDLLEVLLLQKEAGLLRGRLGK